MDDRAVGDDQRPLDGGMQVLLGMITRPGITFARARNIVVWGTAYGAALVVVLLSGIVGALTCVAIVGLLGVQDSRSLGVGIGRGIAGALAGFAAGVGVLIGLAVVLALFWRPASPGSAEPVRRLTGALRSRSVHPRALGSARADSPLPRSPWMKNALFVAAFDSQLKWCGRIRDEFASRGYECRVVVPDIRSALSEQQIRDAGFDRVDSLSWSDLLDVAVISDVVVCGLSGPITKGFSIELADRRNATGVIGPVLITGWVGVIIEKITAGYLDRCASDIVAVNSVADFDHFTAVGARLGLPPDNLLLTGLPFLSPRPQPQRTGEIKRVLYADQPTVPGREVERRYVYQKLVDYAVAHPDRDVILKPRHRPGEDTFHRMLYHPENVLAGIDQPPNFRIDYTPIGEVLDSVDLMITMSSTACLEALDHGCRVGLVLDLGVHERYGNQVFLDSGLLRTFDQLGADQIGTPEPDFLASYFLDRDEASTAIIADRADELVEAGTRPSHTTWQTDYLRSAADFHYATSAGPGGRRQRSSQHSLAALRHRVSRHGTLKGVLAQASVSLLPPILNRSLRTLIKNSRG